MSILSFGFFLLVLAGLVVYYVLPAKVQWMVLLALSCIFYMCAGLRSVVWICLTAFTVFIGASAVDALHKEQKKYLTEKRDILKREEIKKYKEGICKKKRMILVSVLLINIGILFWMKYFGFILQNILAACDAVSVMENTNSGLGFVLPLGISFYTFSALGYFIDVYGGSIEAERNPLRLLLFLSFFPQVAQGPIARYQDMSAQFEKPHRFYLETVEKGAVLVLWGLFKKLVIANRAVYVVDGVFGNPTQYSGAMTCLAVLFYSIWQYTDFSGGIDIVTGVAQMYGIALAPNFKRPYFSKSLAEFWRRWHISLGAWMRDYVFYPLSMSKGMMKIMGSSRKVFGDAVGRYVPAAVCNIIVFLLVGIWHGPYWHFVVWGLYNGMMIGCGYLFRPLFEKGKKAFRIHEEKKSWQIFCMARTFLIVNIGWFFDKCEVLKDALFMMKNMVFHFRFSEFHAALLASFGLNKIDYLILGAAVAILFLVSVMQECRGSVRDKIFSANICARWVILYALTAAVLYVSMYTGGVGGFAYEQF